MSSSDPDLDLDRALGDVEPQSSKPDTSDEPPKPSSNEKTSLPDPVTRKRRKEKILAALNQLPSLPTVVGEVMQIANDPDSSARDFEDAIRKDQSLTARLLKMVNSSYYGLRDEVTTIQRAVTVLGFKTLKNVVVAASTSNLLNRQLEIYGYSENGLWHHSIACAVVCRKMAGDVFDFGSEVAEEAFVAGLLHDIGKIIISPVLSKYSDDFEQYVSANPACTLLEAEQKVAGIDHTETGREMMSRWNLSDRLSTSITNHHEAHNAPPEEEHYAELLELSDLISLQKGYGLASDYPWRNSVPAELRNQLDLSDERLDELYEIAGTLEEDINEMVAILQD